MKNTVGYESRWSRGLVLAPRALSNARIAAVFGLAVACGSSNSSSDTSIDAGREQESGAASEGSTGGNGNGGSGASSGSSSSTGATSGAGGSSGSSGSSGGTSGSNGGTSSGASDVDAGGSSSGSTPDGSASGVVGGGDDGGPASSATSTANGNGCTPPAQYENLFITVLGQTQAASDAKLAAAWNQLFNPSNANTVFYNGPGTDESYVEDIADNDVRTEGQSYGMMIALQLNHQTEFDRLWTFAKNHMHQASTGQYAWETSTSGTPASTSSAPDGDEWFATALVFAHNRWGDTSGKFNYGTEASTILSMIRTTDFDATYHLVRYYAGTSSNGTDGSYDLPAFYQVWACFDTANAAFWNAAVTAGRTFFHNAADATGFIGDQSQFTGASTNTSGDDKLRCVANIMSDHNFFNADSWQTETYAPEYAKRESGGTTSTAELACDGLLGFGLPTATGKPFVQNLWSVAIPSGMWRYYDGTLYTLALLHVSGAFRLWY